MNNSIIGILTILAFIFIVNWVGMAMQLRDYRKTINSLSDKYNDGYIGVGMGKASFTPRKIVLIVVNNEGNIVETRIMSGITVFAQLKKNQQFDGRNINEIAKMNLKRSLQDPMNQAVELVKKENNKL